MGRARSLLSLPLSVRLLWLSSAHSRSRWIHYLVATQGWVNGKISSILNTIQVISPYTGKATILSVNGFPASEAPASFVVQSHVGFLVGTKSLNTQFAVGNLYVVRFQGSNKPWLATCVNKAALPINASDMVVYNNNAYVIGSTAFNRTGDDAQILRISLRTGIVSKHLQIGNKFFKTNGLKPGAMGLGSALVLVGKTLHAFTFDTTLKTGQYNEHWTVSTSLPVQARMLPSLPLSRRMQGVKLFNGFGTSGAFIDPENSKGLVVVGRWGEIVWRDLNGNNKR